MVSELRGAARNRTRSHFPSYNNFPCSPLTSLACARLNVERPSDKSGLRERSALLLIALFAAGQSFLNLIWVRREDRCTFGSGVEGFAHANSRSGVEGLARECNSGLCGGIPEKGRARRC